MDLWVRICISPFSSPVENFGYYSYPVNVGISRQNEDEFGRYPRVRIYLLSLVAD